MSAFNSMRKAHRLSAGLGVLLIIAGSGVCRSVPEADAAPPARFRRVFCWGTLRDEETACRFSEIGVTDIRVFNTNQLAWARRHGLTPYCGTFGPKGPHNQQMSPEEERHFAHINGTDLRELPADERRAVKDRRRLEANHRYGGEPDAPLDTLNDARLPCFISDAGLELSRKSIDAICDRMPGVEGIFFDYLGYSNFKGCYCENCLEAYRVHLADHGLEDTPEHRAVFYRDKLVGYYNGHDMLEPGIAEVFRKYCGRPVVTADEVPSGLVPEPSADAGPE